MNQFGTLFKLQIFGESHGACVGVVVDGCPAGLSLKVEDFVVDMERRKGGKQKVPLQDRKMICLFLNQAYSMILLQVRH